MGTLSLDLQAKLQRNPNATVSVIVRLKDSPDAHLAALQARGLTVRHTYSLISAVAVQGTAAIILALAKEPWVLSLEEDKPVHTM